MLDNVYFLGHSTIKFIKAGKIIYVDPYMIENDLHDADVIFITHNHYDHFSKVDLLKVKKDDTILFVTEDLYDDSLRLGFLEGNIVLVKPNEHYKLDDIKMIKTVPAYNINKSFHPKDNNWVGYNLLLDNYTYYIVGDSDMTDEAKEVKCDVLFVPIGGTYTMDYKEASILTNIINPKIVVPVHYGVIVGDKEDALKFKELINDSTKCEIMD